MKCFLLFCLALIFPEHSFSQVWVDGESGDDRNPGTKEAPLASIEKGLERVEPGETLHILPRESPWPTGVRITKSGTAEKPIVVDGHGSLLSGRRFIPDVDWQSHGDGVFSRPLPNNAWGMPRFWEGGFPLVWFAGREGRNVSSRSDLESGCYFLYKNQKELKTDPLHNTLFIRLEPDQTPGGAEVENIVGEGGIFVGGDYVTVRNFVVEYGGRDGYATHRNKGVVFENVEARFFMDQGMSHHGAEVTVRKAYFHDNAGCGIVDVYPEAKVRYENCLIENDTWRGGVEFHSGEFEMIDCTIRNHPKTALAVTRGAVVTLENCRFEGGPESVTGVSASAGTRLTLNRCSVVGFPTGIVASLDSKSEVAVRGCSVKACEASVSINVMRSLEAPEVSLPRVLSWEKNDLSGSDLTLTDKAEHSGGWKVETSSHQSGAFESFITDAIR